MIVIWLDVKIMWGGKPVAVSLDSWFSTNLPKPLASSNQESQFSRHTLERRDAYWEVGYLKNQHDKQVNLVLLSSHLLKRCSELKTPNPSKSSSAVSFCSTKTWNMWKGVVFCWLNVVTTIWRSLLAHMSEKDGNCFVRKWQYHNCWLYQVMKDDVVVVSDIKLLTFHCILFCTIS
jgi:hypothetical protein